jgi:hypothetical protein
MLSKFFNSGITVNFQNAACCSWVSFPERLVVLSLMFATRGGIPYFASIVYKFHRFSSKNFAVSGVKLSG